MATVAEHIDQILRRLDELSTTDPVHWSREEILVFINEALIELNLIAWEFQDSASVVLNSTDNVYDQPSPILAALAVRCPHYLRRQTAEDIDREAKWESSVEKRFKVRTWAPIGLGKFLVHPRPIETTTAYVEGIIEHTAVTDTAMSLPVRPEYESAIDDYCVERATFKEGPSELEQTGALYRNFLDKVQQSSGRNVVRMYPRFSTGTVAETGLREQVEEGVKQDGD